MQSLSEDAFAIKFKSRDCLEKSGFSKGVKLMDEIPFLDGNYVLIDSVEPLGYQLVINNGRYAVYDYMLDLDTKISIEEARKNHSALFL